MPDRVGAVLLAAGGGSRFVGPVPKLTADVGDGSTLAASAARVAVDAAIGPVLVVVGPVAAERLGLPDGVQVSTNERWAEGQATSLGVAIGWAGDAGLDAVVVALADQPGLSAGAWRAVAGTRSTPIAVATYDGRRAHPVRLAAEVWASLPTSGDEGARRLLRDRPDLVTEVPCPGDPVDIDTAADLAAWRARIVPDP